MYRFALNKNTIFIVQQVQYVVNNNDDDIVFEQLTWFNRWKRTGKVYTKTRAEITRLMDEQRLTRYGMLDESPDTFYFGLGVVFYYKVFYVVIGFGLNTTRFVEAEKTLYGYKKKDVVYTKSDEELFKLQEEGLIDYAGLDLTVCP